ncbi:DUF2218 domain-containing protein [Corynebacterium epidermidicanis]|uniref:DUF2218 domain-containing protein n=1 Tax=Corynebacterium epidermidicanis TaxID=1050174 RepID=UPI000A004922|nr:DUF2218 domain-containing protein [Corynebacterium epidermidicanis]
MTNELHSIATVATDRPARYAKQLTQHFGKKATTIWDSEAEKGDVSFAPEEGSARVELTCEEGALMMNLWTTPENLERFEHVVGGHVERFGVRDELVVSWHQVIHRAWHQVIHRAWHQVIHRAWHQVIRRYMPSPQAATAPSETRKC